MITKIMTRASFAGIVNYAHNQENDQKKAKLLDYKDVCIVTNASIADSFAAQAAMRGGISKPVKHISLAFSPNDASLFTNDSAGDELMVKIAKDWMKQMGFNHTQYIIARHHDTEHPHCHLVCNRIDNQGNVIPDNQERIRNLAVCKSLTQKYGLYMAPLKSKKPPTSKLRGYEAKRLKLRNDIKGILDCSSNWKEFLKLLKEAGITHRFGLDRQTSEIRGISFANDQLSISGSKLAPKLLSYGALNKVLGHSSIQEERATATNQSSSLLVEQIPSVKKEHQADSHTQETIVSNSSLIEESPHTSHQSRFPEWLLQPDQLSVGTGGGGSDNNSGWRDKENEEDENQPRTYKRRR